jgi:hypothetical protein
VPVTEEHVKLLLKLVHGSKKSKLELVEEFVASSSGSGLSKNLAFKIFSQVYCSLSMQNFLVLVFFVVQVICKKSGRWAISNEALNKHPGFSDMAADIWKSNAISAQQISTAVPNQESPPKAPLQQQLIFRTMPKQPSSAGRVQGVANSTQGQASDGPGSEVLEQFGCLPV